MMSVILDFMRQTQQELSIPVGKVLEVGSLNVNGTARTVFQPLASEYHGVDLEPGNCVDLVMSGEDLTKHFPSDYFDTVICCETLEHCVRPWRVVEEMKKVLKPGGHLWLSTPTFGFPLHRFPLDCYRFGEDAYRLFFFQDCKLLALEHVADELGQPAIVAVGQTEAK
jgi:SAM-dependent methyltransferase